MFAKQIRFSNIFTDVCSNNVPIETTKLWSLLFTLKKLIIDCSECDDYWHNVYYSIDDDDDDDGDNNDSHSSATRFFHK